MADRERQPISGNPGSWLGVLSQLVNPPAPSEPAHLSQVVTAICLGVRLEPSLQNVAPQIEDAEKRADTPPNEMQKLLARDLGIAIDSKATRGSVCMQLLNVYHTDPVSFSSKPSRAFQDRFCGGPFERFGDWLPAEAKTDFKSQFPHLYEFLTGLAGVCLSVALFLAPFVLLWWAATSLWNAIFG